MNKYEQFSKKKENRKAAYKRIHGAANSCTRKKKHNNEHEALKWHEKNNHAFNEVHDMVAYKCKFCLHWHLAKQR